uniref:N-acetylgalactosaminide beta-1,3-galactosyltransferase n=2 Tax=Petromyzon marinus TaxID=7757 RepID=A0AAJ7WQI6_PETMA|nr:glycoprotein-N-acetylgalactosamine 3-beta-galactosyltransferase 1-like [Petromyzon marinus]
MIGPLRPSLTLLFGVNVGFGLTYIFLLATSNLDVAVTPREPARRDALRELRARVRVLCWVVTCPQNVESRARHQRDTWTRACDRVLFLSSVDDAEFPAVGLGTEEGRQHLYWKTTRAILYLREHHVDDADWFLKADDDTYVLVDNLRLLLSGHSARSPVYFGRRFKDRHNRSFMSGGAGYVLSRAALVLAADGFGSGQCGQVSLAEDVAIGACLEKVGVAFGDSRDSAGRETFHPFVPEKLLVRDFISNNSWYWRYCYHRAVRGPQCCSDYPVSFHYVRPSYMHVLEYLVHRLRPYGYAYRYTAELPDDPEDV